MEVACSVQWYGREFLADPDVLKWDVERVGAYVLILHHVRESNGFSQLNDEEMRIVLRKKSIKKAQVLWSTIRHKFQLVNGCITHKRVTEQLQAQARHRFTKQLAGKVGAAKRWQTHDFTNGKPMADPLVTDSSSTSTSTSTKRKHTKDIAQVSEVIYQAYPRKVGKRAAIPAIGRAITRIGNDTESQLEKHKSPAWLLAKVKKYAASPAGQAGKFTPHPATWFNEGRYDDDEKEWQVQGKEQLTSRIEAEPGKYDGLGVSVDNT